VAVVADADVAVHVDAKPFARELKSKLEPIVKAASKNAKVQMDVDDKGLEEKVRVAAAKAGSRSTAKVGVEADVDRSRISRMVASVQGLVAKAGGKLKLALPVSIEAGIKNLGQDISRILKSAASKVRLAIPVTLEAGAKDALRGIDEFIRRVASKAHVLIPFSFGDNNSGTSLLSKLQKGLSAVTSAAQNAASAIAGGLSSAFSTLSSVAGPALIALVVVLGVQFLGTLITATGVLAGVTAGLVAMGTLGAAAFGIFAVAAIPTISKIIKAVQGGNDEIKKLPKNLQGAATAVVGLKNAFSAWLKPLQGPIAGLVTQLANLGRTILPAFTPVVTGITNAFSGFIAKISTSLQSTTMLTFFNNLGTVGVRIFTNIADAAGHFGLGLISLVNTFAPFAESLSRHIDNVAKSFSNWAASVKGTNAVQDFITWVKDNGKDLLSGLKDLADKVPGYLRDLSSKDVKGDLKDLTTILNGIADAIKAVTSAANAAKSAFKFLKDFQQHPDLNPFDSDKTDKKEIKQGNVGKVSGKGSGDDPAAPIGPAQGFDFSGLSQKASVAASAIQTAFSAAFNVTKTLAGAAIQFIGTSLVNLAVQAPTFLSGLGTSLYSAFSTAFGLANTAISFGVSTAASIIGSLASRAYVALSGFGGTLLSIGSAAASSLASGIGSGIRIVGSAATALGSRIEGELASVGSRAYNAGASIASRIAKGISDGVRLVANAASSLAGAIASHLPHSPVEEGPLKVLNRGHAGGRIAEMVADGISKMAPLIDKAMSGALTIPASRIVSSGSNTNTQITKSPIFHVTSPSANPLEVAMAMFRQARMSGAF
jgi:hypothetical protein